MALDFISLQTEFYARGFDYLNDGGGAGAARAKRWINDAMHFIDAMPDGWPYLFARLNLAAPVVLTDLSRVKSVQYQNQPLTFASYEWLSDACADLTVTGTPVYYYVTENSVESRTISTYPVSTATLTVGYLRSVPDLVGNTETPWMPDRFRYAIVEYAVAKALRDESNYQEALAAKQAGDEIVQGMRDFYWMLPGGFDVQELTFASDDW